MENMRINLKSPKLFGSDTKQSHSTRSASKNSQPTSKIEILLNKMELSADESEKRSRSLSPVNIGNLVIETIKYLNNDSGSTRREIKK